jgi:hypothetical protein
MTRPTALKRLSDARARLGDVFKNQGYHSAWAKAGHTRRSGPGNVQLHDEYIVYEDCAAYPEFVVTFDML